MAYNNQVKLYYLGEGEIPSSVNRCIPAPLMSIQPEILYANNVAIGKLYKITLDGYATALDLDTYTGGDLDFTDTMLSVKKIRNIFSKDLGTLKVIDNTGEIIVASGGLLESLSFEQTDNNWFNYAKYTANISFTSLSLGNCSGIVTDPECALTTDFSSINSPYLLDMSKYRIKSVTDEWTIDANNIYITDNDTNLQNEYFDITYTIQAVGSPHLSSATIVPSWQQAKKYCIDRLKQEVGRLSSNQIGPLTSVNQHTTCTHTTSYANLSNTTNPGLLYLLTSSSGYKIYNETIETSASESDGSFSLNYKSILKKVPNLNNNLFNDTHAIHKISVVTSTSVEDDKTVLTKTIRGEIEGLVESNLIGGTSSSTLYIPDNGLLLGVGSKSTSKYDNALAAYNKIGGNDLKEELVVGILDIKATDFDPLSITPNDKPKKNSHNVAHNYNAGTISYTEDYNNQNIIKNSGIEVTNISMTIEDSINQTAEFIVPGRAEGPIIQKLTAQTPKKITIAIDGISNNRCPIFNDICASGITLPSGVPATGLASYEITENRYNFNHKDGSFTINRAYIYIG